MKTSKAFKLTKKFVSKNEDDDLEQFICIAAIDADVSYKIVPIIENLLDGYYTLSEYVEEKTGISYFNQDYKKMQKTRHAWLDHLIKHYQSIGD